MIETMGPRQLPEHTQRPLDKKAPERPQREQPADRAKPQPCI